VRLFLPMLVRTIEGVIRLTIRSRQVWTCGGMVGGGSLSSAGTLEPLYRLSPTVECSLEPVAVNDINATTARVTLYFDLSSSRQSNLSIAVPAQ